MVSSASGSQPDAALVRAARDGDKEAVGVLIIRHRPMALALVARLLGSSDQAADVVQEAAVTALVGLDRLRSPERFGAWFAGIALNVGRRWLREALVTATALSFADRPDERQGPDAEALSAVFAQRVRAAVNGLAPGQRAAVLAFYWQGLSHAEAAHELGVHPGAVKDRLHKARAALAPALKGELELSNDHERRTPAMASTDDDWIEAEVAEVRRSSEEDPMRRVHVIVLRERGRDRRVPIYVGGPEATALAFNLESVETPRPMTYAMTAGIAAAAGARIVEVRITTLAEATIYAVVRIDGPKGPQEVDARPSDALNLALVAGSPIFIDARVLSALEETSPRWKHFPTGADDLVDETRSHQAEMRAMVEECRSGSAAGE
jgi:RNA polymerase sigma factor (sigma-70 family)